MNKQAAIARQIAEQLGVSSDYVLRTIQLLEEGNTIPFVARYRKEVTGGLDEIQLRQIQDLWSSAKELEKRKVTILKTIESLGALTDDLRAQIVQCSDQHLLEELYLPFRPKRKSRATVAKERGLQPLADLLLAQRPLSKSRDEILKPFVNVTNDVPDAAAALSGALDIVTETWADNPSLRQWMTERAQRGQLVSRVKRGKQQDGRIFETYFDYSERINRVPSHRILAMKRGEAEGFLRLSVQPDLDYVMPRLEQRLIRNLRFEFVGELKAAISDCYKRLLQPAAESAVMKQLKENADESAIQVFARNIRELLLAPPAGPHVTIGIDPGFRTGCKLAVVDATGRFLENQTIYPTPPHNDISGSSETLLKLIQTHNATMIAIGNGTASRETDAFVTALLKDHDLQVTKSVVSEAGASVYSASELAASEYPDLDVTVRGAISIAHRLQDPLAELVKVDPKSIGVGQYQHDVNQARLQTALDREVQSCVSSVGVNVNTASPALLGYIPGIGPGLAQKIVGYRDVNGAFQRRADLLMVPKLGARAFEQSAGFLRVPGGAEPLDNSAVHPERYPVVSRMAENLNVTSAELVGNKDLVARLQPKHFIDDTTGEYTVSDILQELARPGRDPREQFQTVQFAENIHHIGDLAEGMQLEGVVTNVTHFGAFVDIGVHQDGLIHISQLADHFVTDASQEVKVGDVVKVTVLEVDESRKRISLSRKEQQ